MQPLTDPVAIALFGAAIGAFLAIAAVLALSPIRGAAWWTSILLMIGAAMHGADWLIWRITTERGFFAPFWLLSAIASGFFWAFVQASFEDRAAAPWRRLVPAAVLAGAALFGASLARPASLAPWLFYNVLVIVLMAHAFWMLAQGYRGDLVEGRRRLRAPLLAATIGYIILVQLTDIVSIFGGDFRVAPVVQGIALLALALAAAAMLLKAEGTLLAPAKAGEAKAARPGAPESAVDPQDQALANRLAKAMDEDEVWRREELNIGGLADMLRTPEHRLRHLINAQLGHRNFAAFVNARRIEAAKAALADPDNGRKPVSAIAFELGFGSLGPFNRAFKEATGATPTQWRAQALSASPNSQNS
jgi:AraC-like DNA-binding protein